MKDKILIFIIGLLVGAIIVTGCFLVYEKNNRKNFQMPNGGMEKFDGKNPPEMPEGFSENGERPELSEGFDKDGKRPEMTSKDGSQEQKSEQSNKSAEEI